jgi:DNA-binding GntR family transcriptional regulator
MHKRIVVVSDTCHRFRIGVQGNSVVAEARRSRNGVQKSSKTKATGGRAADSVDRVYEVLKGLSVEFHFKPNERVNEVEIAARLGVSRTPVRGALTRLAREGFMSFVPNRGYYSRGMTPEAVRELYELRAAIERAAFKLACERGTDAEIAAAVAIWERNSKIGSTTDWTSVAEADEVFHVAIVRMSKNERMVEALESINSLIRFFRRIDLESERRRGGLYDEHAGIVDCLKRRDADQGCELIERHITLSAAHAVDVAKEGLARIFFGSSPHSTT